MPFNRWMSEDRNITKATSRSSSQQRSLTDSIHPLDHLDDIGDALLQVNFVSILGHLSSHIVRIQRKHGNVVTGKSEFICDGDRQLILCCFEDAVGKTFSFLVVYGSQLS